jgi:MFS family permease
MLKMAGGYMKFISKVRNYFRVPPVARRYMFDGLFISTAVNIAANTNNLFATRLGANDYQLSMIQFMPMMFNLILLLPCGFLIDSFKNKKRLVMGMLIFCALGYFLCGLSPLLPSQGNGVYFFLVFLSFASGAVALYNISWQAFFPDVVDVGSRNQVYSLRTQVTMFTGMMIPLLSGSILSFVPSTPGKIIAHQLFYFISGLMFLLGARNFSHVTATRQPVHRRVSFDEIKKALASLKRNKPFLIFIAVAMVFYISWQADWTLYYIGQAQYLKLNEFMLALVVVCGTGMQLFTLHFWSRQNEKHGVVLPVTFGILGLALCPLSMIAAVSLPQFIGPYAFVVFNTLSNAAFITVSLNMFQCQLQVADEHYRSITLSLFSCMTCLSNAVMPVAGVALYQWLGGDRDALRITFALIFALRIIAAGLWALRWKTMKK